jgi:hypothetical protein
MRPGPWILAVSVVGSWSALSRAQVPAPPPPPPPPPHGDYLHDGLYVHYGLGPVELRLSGAAPGTSFTSTGGGFGQILAVGGTIPNGVVIGGAGSLVASSSGVVGNFGALVDWFPDARDGWHVGGLLGLGLVRGSPLLAPASVTTAQGTVGGSTTGPDLLGFGFGATLFGGYDLWLAPQFSLGMDLVGAAMTSAAMKESNGVPSPYRFTPLWFGFLASVVYH